MPTEHIQDCSVAVKRSRLHMVTY